MGESQKTFVCAEFNASSGAVVDFVILVEQAASQVLHVDIFCMKSRIQSKKDITIRKSRNLQEGEGVGGGGGEEVEVVVEEAEGALSRELKAYLLFETEKQFQSYSTAPFTPASWHPLDPFMLLSHTTKTIPNVTNQHLFSVTSSSQQ